MLYFPIASQSTSSGTKASPTPQYQVGRLKLWMDCKILECYCFGPRYCYSALQATITKIRVRMNEAHWGRVKR